MAARHGGTDLQRRPAPAAPPLRPRLREGERAAAAVVHAREQQQRAPAGEAGTAMPGSPGMRGCPAFPAGKGRPC